MLNEISQAQKDQYRTQFHLQEVPRIGECIEKERTVTTRTESYCLVGYVSVWDAAKVLEKDNGEIARQWECV